MYFTNNLTLDKKMYDVLDEQFLHGLQQVCTEYHSKLALTGRPTVLVCLSV